MTDKYGRVFLIRKVFKGFLCRSKLILTIMGINDEIRFYTVHRVDGHKLILAERGINIVKIYLYTKVIQASQNASLYVVLIKIGNEDKDIYNDPSFVKCDVVKFRFFEMKSKQCIWGSLVTFVIKMNFID